MKARSLALLFIEAHPGCIRAIPYEWNGKTHGKAIAMCLYMISDGKEIPYDLKEAAAETFHDYDLEFVAFQRRTLSENVIPLQPDEKNRAGRIGWPGKNHPTKDEHF